MDFLILLFPLGIGAGWLLARLFAGRKSRIPSLSNRYFRGLNYIINEEQDKAIDIFVKILEDNPETVETHISLGALFRRRGETARAINIHENIMSRSNLSNEQRIEAQMELGRDYMRAGLLDRAEILFRELSKLPDYKLNALRFLNEIYDQEQDWDRAVEIAEQLCELNPEYNWREVIAHYFCEQAEVALKAKEYEIARSYLGAALGKFKSCVRANIIAAKVMEHQGDFIKAVEHYKKIEHQEPEFLPEVLADFVNSYDKIAGPEEIINYLKDLAQKYPSTSLLLTLVEKVSNENGAKAAEKLLIDSLQHKPSVRGLEYLIAINLQKIKNADSRLKLFGLQRMMRQLQEEKPLYKCAVCGFQGKQMHWKCPGCRNWGSIRPIIGVSGE